MARDLTGDFAAVTESVLSESAGVTAGFGCDASSIGEEESEISCTPEIRSGLAESAERSEFGDAESFVGVGVTIADGDAACTGAVCDQR